jgi:hypothetical protein
MEMVYGRGGGGAKCGRTEALPETWTKRHEFERWFSRMTLEAENTVNLPSERRST